MGAVLGQFRGGWENGVGKMDGWSWGYSEDGIGL